MKACINFHICSWVVAEETFKSIPAEQFNSFVLSYVPESFDTLRPFTVKRFLYSINILKIYHSSIF